MVYWEEKTGRQMEALLRSTHSRIGGGAGKGVVSIEGFRGKMSLELRL